MIRLLAYLGSIFIVMIVLRMVPFIGPWFRIPLLGFFTAAALVSFVGTRWAERALERRRMASLRRSLGGVETPYNMGKLGAVLEANGSFKAAIPYLRAAADGESDSAEWHWRLGHCLLEAGNASEALESLRRAAELDDGVGYGALLMQLSEALRKTGQLEEALKVVDRAERNHGPNPESAYRRGRLLRELGRKEDAARSFADVSELAHRAVAYQRAGNRPWVWRALWARIFG